MSDGEATPTVPSDAISKTAAWWFNMLKYVGWPGIILIAIGYGVYNVAVWSAPKVESVVNSHITVVTGLLEQQKIQNENQGKTNKILEEVSENQRSFASRLDHHGEMIHEIHEMIVPARSKSNQ